MDPKRVVAEGYDRMAEQYLASKDGGDEVVAKLEELTDGLPTSSRILDLGCGAGVPATSWLAARFDVTGVDLSESQLQLARRHAPGATFVRADMGAVDFLPHSFDAVVALYSIIHVPRTEQPALLSKVRRWLRPGGRFLATWAMHAWEGQEANWQGWGAAMWWSHYGAGENLEMIQDAGFEIQAAEPVTQGDETWLWVLANRGRAPASEG